MFAKFSYDDFPIIKVEFNSNLNNDYDYQEFISEWTKLYYGNKSYILVIDTTNIISINKKYYILISSFMTNINKKANKNLVSTYIIINKENNLLLRVFDLIFLLQKILSPVYISNYSFEIIKDYLEKYKYCKIYNCEEEKKIILKKYLPPNSQEDELDSIFRN